MQWYIYLWIVFIISIWLHEFAHAWTANKLWDPTPKMQWRLTINPLKHIDILWFILIFIVQFWWWKPVTINPHYFSNRRRDELLVALAWPAMNFFLSFVGILVMFIYASMVFLPNLPLWDMISKDMFLEFWYLFSWINIVLWLFNIIPLWPLDWWRIVQYIFPKTLAIMKQYNYQMIMMFVFFLVVIWPWQWFVSYYMQNVGTTIFSFFYAMLATVFW